MILGLAHGGVFGLMGSGLSLVFGVMRVVNLAHPVLFIGGVYVTYWAWKLLGVDPLITVLMEGAILAATGVLIYKVFFEKDAQSAKYSDLTVLMAFAVAMIVEGFLGGMFTNTQRVTYRATQRMRFSSGISSS